MIFKFDGLVSSGTENSQNMLDNVSLQFSQPPLSQQESSEEQPYQIRYI